MNWQLSTNHVESHLSLRAVIEPRNKESRVRATFGIIRRDFKNRVAQIQFTVEVFGSSKSDTEWIPLTDFRYGMSPEEEALDIEATGISVQQWAQMTGRGYSTI